MAANGFPDRGTGRGESNASLDAFPEPLGDAFFSVYLIIFLSDSEVLFCLNYAPTEELRREFEIMQARHRSQLQVYDS
jgi:hypothetical protein